MVEHYVGEWAESLHAFEQLYFCERQLIMYSLGISGDFMAHNGSRELEALNFLELPHRLHHNYVITTEE